MRAEVARFIARERLITAGAPMWVAVSGGVDSMVLLHVLRDLGHPCSVVHVDHGLRGAESEADRAFVEAHCAEARIPCRVVRVDVAAEAERGGTSVQMAARTLRYAAFRTLLQEGPGTMALGHHADDAVETLLLHLMRGTGLHGWAAIPPAREGFIRPLLGVGRAAIRAYAERWGVAFREDASNADPKYLRNRVRNEVLPLLNALRPGADRAMARSVHVLRELEALGDAHVKALCERFRADGEGGARLPLAELASSATPLLLLRAWCSDADLHPSMVDAIRSAVAHGNTGARFYLKEARITVDRDALLLERAVQPPLAYSIHDGLPGGGGPFTWQFRHGPPTGPAQGSLLLDADRLHYPLELRPWRPGDRMRPAGLGGSKLISDLLIDAKVPRAEKDRTYVLVSAGEVLWLAGHRMAEGTRPTQDTKRVLYITA